MWRNFREYFNHRECSQTPHPHGAISHPKILEFYWFFFFGLLNRTLQCRINLQWVLQTVMRYQSFSYSFSLALCPKGRNLNVNLTSCRGHQQYLFQTMCSGGVWITSMNILQVLKKWLSAPKVRWSIVIKNILKLWLLIANRLNTSRIPIWTNVYR